LTFEESYWECLQKYKDCLEEGVAHLEKDIYLSPLGKPRNVDDLEFVRFEFKVCVVIIIVHNFVRANKFRRKFWIFA